MSHNRECVSIEQKAGVIHGRAVENCLHNHGAPIVYRAVSYVGLYIAIAAISLALVATAFYIFTHRKYVRSARHAE